MNKRKDSRIPGLRDMTIIGPDGREVGIEATDVELGRPATGEPVERRAIFPSGSVTFTVKLTAEGERMLRYWLVVRPMLYEPLEYRLN